MPSARSSEVGRRSWPYLRGLFSDDNFNAGTLKAPPETSLRVLTPDVVLVSAHLQVEGQKLVGGGEIEVRDNHSLRVLQRQGDGSWLIVSEMYNDANREADLRPGRVTPTRRARRTRTCLRRAGAPGGRA